ncbi:4-oxalocrotonate tautomerase [Pseudoxanthomonas kalamensis DSM 18571]|uniref:tautomerase family protein n=1 Tax=Pseudoxanthomonas kalamensis TaxID=289483 RepID=UPI001390D529|nr:tautomerase family protein [Pseudoxanthomonas kalamensis]KAF1711552.1 4-oxalocrotonate tautomerase [Pseudoxanthomonas kalamensis DSM 18571]
MPIIEMHLMEGRTDDQKSAVAEAVTEAVVRTLGVRSESVRILITEHGPMEFFVAGKHKTQRASRPNGSSVEKAI